MPDMKPAKSLNIWVLATGLLAVVVIALALYSLMPRNTVSGADGKPVKVLGSQEVSDKLTGFFGEVYGERIQVTIKSITDVNGLYKVNVEIKDLQGGTQETGDIYVSKDGALFIPQALPIEEALQRAREAKAAASAIPSEMINPETSTTTENPTDTAPQQ